MTFHPATVPVTAVIAIVGIAWKVIRVVNRLEMMLQEYPPHRHINGHIVYPKGYTPEKAQSASAGR